jgi:SAM-dependent methyltransferase
VELSRRTVGWLACAAFCLRGETAATDQEWAAFIRWVKALQPGAVGNQKELFPTYEKKLIADGMPPADAQALAARLQKRSVEVTGLDVSQEGVSEAVKRAREAGVRIDARVQDIYKFDFGANQWDLVCLLYFGKIPENHRDLCQRIATALKPGGPVIVEGTGLPPLETLLAERDKWLPTKLRLVRLEYVQSVQPPWSPPGAGAAHMLLQKPIAPA